MSFFSQKETVLFQGDSVTDCGRNKEEFYSLGTGYAFLIAAQLSATMRENDFNFINRGVSGNRVVDLNRRWDEDCVELNPTVLSILIGINDTWRRYDNNDPTETEVFLAGYRKLLTRAANETDAKIILLEPFLLPVYEAQARWREDLDPKIQAVRSLAREFGALYIPLDGVFAAAAAKKSPAYWSADGVHPSAAGHGLIASEWIRAVKETSSIE